MFRKDRCPVVNRYDGRCRLLDGHAERHQSIRYYGFRRQLLIWGWPHHDLRLNGSPTGWVDEHGQPASKPVDAP